MIGGNSKTITNVCIAICCIPLNRLGTITFVQRYHYSFSKRFNRTFVLFQSFVSLLFHLFLVIGCVVEQLFCSTLHIPIKYTTWYNGPKQLLYCQSTRIQKSLSIFCNCNTNCNSNCNISISINILLSYFSHFSIFSFFLFNTFLIHFSHYSFPYSHSSYLINTILFIILILLFIILFIILILLIQ